MLRLNPEVDEETGEVEVVEGSMHRKDNTRYDQHLFAEGGLGVVKRCGEDTAGRIRGDG